MGVGVKSFHQAKIRAITLVLCGPERVALEGLALPPHPCCIILLNLRCGLEKQSKPSAQAGMGKKAQKVLNLCAAFIDFPPLPGTQVLEELPRLKGIKVLTRLLNA